MSLYLKCQKCHSSSPEELLYCTTCHASLFPKTKCDLDFKDYAYGPDMSAIDTVKATGFLPYLLKRFTVADFEKRMLSTLSSEALRVQYPSELDKMARQCANRLSLETLPEIFVVEDSQPNAFTFGGEDHSHVVLVSSLLRILSSQELAAVIGHEFGHVKSGHMLYHTLAEVLAGGIGVSATLLRLDVISIPLRLALLSWHRESEITADRASLLVVNDIKVLETLLHKFANGRSAPSNESGRSNDNLGIIEAAGELIRTHPLDSKRFKLANQFVQSLEFQRARRKIEHRQKVIGALIPECRFCGRNKPIEDLFCPSCGKSQI
jgi:Zn-dependent protease with chaperone function